MKKVILERFVHYLLFEGNAWIYMKLRHFLADPLSIYVLYGGNDALQNKEKWGKMPFFRVRKVQNKADKCIITPGRWCGRLKSGRSLSGEKSTQNERKR